MANVVGEGTPAGKKMIDTLGLTGSPVGVRVLAPQQAPPPDALRLGHHRYCQGLMMARQGTAVVLDGEGLACPAAAAAFGFKPLPEGLVTGKGLVGFGIAADAGVGAAMFAGMPRLESGRVGSLHLFPLDTVLAEPDVVVVEDEVERLMWIGLAYLNATGGERLTGSTAILQATCVDSTIIPLLESRLNYGYGCYGCREATNLAPGEAVLGFPGFMLPSVVTHLEMLGSKAIPNSRAKRPWQALVDRGPAAR